MAVGLWTVGEVLPFPFNMNLNESNLLWFEHPNSLGILQKTLFSVILTERFHVYQMKTFIVQEVRQKICSEEINFKTFQSSFFCLGCFCCCVMHSAWTHEPDLNELLQMELLQQWR